MLRGQHEFTGSPYGDHYSLYQSPRNLFLSVGFSPLDGHSAVLRFGRLWTYRDAYYTLSSSYYSIARIFGFSHPAYYELEYGGDAVAKTIQLIITDLSDSLSVVLRRIDTITLIAAERQQFGAETIARTQFGDKFELQVKVEETI